MRVLYFTEKDSPHDRRFLNALSETAHQVHVLRQYSCSPETPAGVAELDWPDGYPDWSDWRGWQKGITRLMSILDEVQPDLVHAGPVQGPALLTALADFHPLVTMSWGSDLLRRAQCSPWMRFATACTLERTDILLADCQAVADEAARYGFPQERVVRFPWGVDLDHFSPSRGMAAGKALREALGWEDNFVVMCSRTWAPVYGVDLLAGAFVEAVQINPDLRLLLVGDGPQADLVHEILAEVQDKVALPGWVSREKLTGFYCAADLFGSPSHCDGSSISLLEALACGRPVLVSDIPGNREWVKPGDVGELFLDGDLTSLTNQLLKMAENDNLEGYAKRARELAEQRADWQVNFQHLLSAYDMAVKLSEDTSV
jgi:glycosyltransferase involved in cell wall biosynthesis